LSEIRQLKEQLESLLESKDRLVASVSHELRTPLTGVIGLTELIREAAGDSLDEETSEMLDLVVEQGNELSNIIEDLLVHARAEAGTLTVRHEAFDLVAEAHTVAASHNLTDPIGPPAAHVLGDPLRVRQVLRNLITNARRYGGSTITVEIARRGDFYAASVVDDGSGVPPGAAETIFEPYRSAHDSVGQPGSVGIGLALSRSMAQLMGGDLTYSRTDGLTRFTLRVQAETPLRSDSMVLQGASDLGTVRR
jgi:signal transduction histidine kinase